MRLTDRAEKKAEQLKKNVALAGHKVFAKNCHLAMLRPILEGRSILDYVVIIDLGKAPPVVGSRLASSYLSKHGHHPSTKSIIDQNRSNGDITCSIQRRVSLATADCTNHVGIIPKAWAPCGSWTDYQTEVEEMLSPDIQAYKGEDAQTVVAREKFIRDQGSC